MKSTTIVCAVAASASVGSIAFAQQSNTGLEEILVTATRREQNLQDVPISIVAMTGDTLEMRGLDTLEDVSQAVPNLIITGGGGGTSNSQFRVRGIPNVSTYIDGVWQVGTGGGLVQEFVDLDRIEVLRGPQGTMFGRDSMGGAVRLWTKRPAEELAADITATIGNLDHRDVKASIDIPFTEKLKSRFSAASFSRDGYIHSQQTNENNGGVDQEVFRGDLVWDATDNLSFRLNYSDYASDFTEPRVQDAMFRTFAEMKQIIGLPEFYGLAGAEPFTPVNLWAGYPGGRVGEWENRSDITIPNTFDTEQAIFEVNWDLNDKMSLQLTTSDTSQDGDQYVDWDNSPYGLVNDLNRSELDVFSQEIQLTGGGDRVTWVGGLYYWDQKTLTRNGRWQLEEFVHPTGYNGIALNPNTVYAQPMCNPAGSPLVPVTPVNPAKPWLVKFADNTPLGDNTATPGNEAWLTCQQVYDSVLTGSYDTLSIAEQDGWAAFGEVTVKLAETWSVTVGLRHHDQSGYSQNMAQIAGVTAPKPFTVNQLHTGGDPFAGTKTGIPNEFAFDKDTTRLSVQKTFNDKVMGYFTYSEGFNSGGVSAPVVRGVRTEVPFAPATLVNYELGLRSDLAGGKVRFNATVFSDTWEDLQAAGVVYDPITGVQLPTLVTTNVGQAEAQGAEFELTYAPSDKFLMNLNLGLLDTAYTDIKPGTMSGHLPLTTGTEFQLAPDTTYTVGFQHNGRLRDGALITTRIDYMYQGQFWRNEPFLRVDAYQAVPDGFDESGDWGTVNMRVSYEPANAPWNVSLWGTNLTDQYMLNSGFFHGIWGYDFATVGRPREYGLTMAMRF